MISRIDNLKTHEEKCGKEKIRKSRNYLNNIDCTICDKKFSSTDAMNFHRKEKHIKEGSVGYLLVQEPQKKEENVCRICPFPRKFSNKGNFKKHMVVKHESRNDKINYKNMSLYLAQDEIEEHQNKVISCELCNEEFSCKTTYKIHENEVHNQNQNYICHLCNKEFNSSEKLRKHSSYVHRPLQLMCSICGKIGKLKCHIEKHIKIHQSPYIKTLKPMGNLQRRQQIRRTKLDVEEFKLKISNVPEDVQKSIWDQIIKDCPYYINRVQENPLSEDEVIDLIKSNNLSDRQVLNICHLLRQKWGRQVITPSISKKLINRKSILNQFFSETLLDTSSDICFTTKTGEKLSRSGQDLKVN